MTLAAGTHLGPYEILGPLGAGGMGEVYRARDTRLDRTVAVKVLPPQQSASPEARLRFVREARAISQLSHPHICMLFDVGQADGVDYLVMELLEGETLQARLGRGPLPLEEALRHGVAIADALEQAHRSGIVHRDLKPQNVMVTKSGAKLLDFGLAKPVGRFLAGSSSSEVATASAPAGMTAEGTILGTLHYMAPEQLEGKAADARTDIFALGGVLYEMLAGKRPFDGTSPAAVASAILKTEPAAIGALRPDCPPALDALVRTCLAKDPAERWQAAHDVKLQLAALGGEDNTPPAPTARPVRRAVPWMAAGLGAALGAAMAVAPLGPGRARREAGPEVRFLVPPPEGRAFASYTESIPVVPSPDGSQLALLLRDPDGTQRVWLRPLSSVQARPLEGTEGVGSAFWSPDGRSLGFFVAGKMKRLDLASGVSQPVCDVGVGSGMDGSWGREGQILFASMEGETIHRVAAAGGVPVEEVRRDPERGRVRVHWPRFLPDGRRFLYLARLRGGDTRVFLGELGKPSRELMAAQSPAQYADPGYLVFVREGTLLGQRFDPAAGRLVGEPFPLAEPVLQFLATGVASVSASQGGVLAYASLGDRTRIVAYDRRGAPEVLAADAFARPGTVRLSPDGRQALFVRSDPRTSALDLWTLDVARRAEERLTSGPEVEAYPVWLPDGRRIAYSAVREGGPPHVFVRDLRTGEERAITPEGAFQAVFDVSPDGGTVVFGQRLGRGTFDIHSVPVAGGPAVALLATPFDENDLRISPDGSLAAFVSNESGRHEVYVAPFPRLAEKSRVSLQGARLPRWGRDGRELLYLTADAKLTRVIVRARPTLEIGSAETLFTLTGRPWTTFDVAPDGRFLTIVPDVLAGEQPVTVMLNGLTGAGR